ncbi:hypothetical protein FXO38_27516 [Capsicum annuum]|nr:hypothetical protein FXO38_27516 [Capsicum annuum]
MDRPWIGMSRKTPEYLLGLNQFLDFAFTNGAIGDKIKCPCPICGFKKWQTKEVVFQHLMNKDFPKHYITWVVHGEINVLPNSKNIEVTQDAQPFENPIELFINEALGGLRHDTVDASPSQVAGEEETLHDLSGSNNKDYFELLKDGNMSRFKQLPKKQNLGPSESTSQASRPAPIDQDTSYPDLTIFLESQPSLLVHLTSHLSPIGWDSSQPSPISRDLSQPSYVGQYSSYPSPVGRDSSYLYPVGRDLSQPYRSVHSTSHSGLENQDSSQSSQSVYSTSYSTLTNQDSSQPAPTNEVATQKHSRCESNTHWVIDAIDDDFEDLTNPKVRLKDLKNVYASPSRITRSRASDSKNDEDDGKSSKGKEKIIMTDEGDALVPLKNEKRNRSNEGENDVQSSKKKSKKVPWKRKIPKLTDLEVMLRNITPTFLEKTILQLPDFKPVDVVVHSVDLPSTSKQECSQSSLDNELALLRSDVKMLTEKISSMEKFMKSLFLLIFRALDIKNEPKAFFS